MKYNKSIDNPLNYLDDTDIICKYRLSRCMITDLFRRLDGDPREPTFEDRTVIEKVGGA